jgi:hypothetical protein
MLNKYKTEMFVSPSKKLKGVFPEKPYKVEASDRK